MRGWTKNGQCDVQLDAALGSCTDFLLDLFLDRDGYVFVLDVQAQTIVEAHIKVSDVDEGEPGDEVASPAPIQELKSGDQKKEGGDVVRKAVLAGEEIEEFTLKRASVVLAAVFAKLARLAEDLFVGDGPRGTGDGKGKKKEEGELVGKGDG